MTSLPGLGPRGEGWVALQALLVLVIALAGGRGPAWSGPARSVSTVIGIGAVAAGLALSIRGVWDLRRSISPLPRPRADAVLVDNGVYRLVRHPIYGGQLVGAVGWGLCRASPLTLAVAVIAAVFFSAKAAREEVWLVGRFPAYDAYRRRTRRLVPGLW